MDLAASMNTAKRLEPFSITVKGGLGRVTLEVYEEDGKICCGLYRLDAHLDLPPKQWLRTMRTEMTKIETIAREAGCVEMRVAGRNWASVLPDYEPLIGPRNGLRKVL
jgi:hypothetical protein